MTYFCTGCFAEVCSYDRICGVCGESLAYDARSYEEKLIVALGHRLPDRQVMAARILGLRRSRAAVPHLARLVASE